MKADKRRKMLLSRAKKLFSKRGYYQTHISDIIKNAGIARGTVYQYFKNKDDIFITLLQTGYEEWQASAAKEMEAVDSRSLSPREYTRFRIRNTLSFFAKDPELSNIILKMGHGLPTKLVQVIDRLDREIMSQMTTEIGWGVRHHVLRKDLDSELTANLVHGTIMRVAYQYFVKKKARNKPEEIDTLVDEILDILAPGMFPPSR